MLNDHIELRGVPGSPYTRKMLAWLRFKRIPYAIHWTRQRQREGYPEPKVNLIPTFYLPDEEGNLEAVVDSTPIIKRLDAEFPNRSSRPSSNVLAFFSDLIEDYADEWLTKIMFHYRWAFEADAANAGPLLAHFTNVQVDSDTAKRQADFITDRQINRLYVVGSNDVTAPIIEASYLRFIEILDQLIQEHGFVLGSRPSSADFGIFGQFTQLAFVEPTPASILAQRSQRVRAWMFQTEDLSGLDPSDDDWIEMDALGSHLKSLLEEIGRTYVPVMLANHAAIDAGQDNFETQVDSQRWVQPTFPYQARCLQWIREAFFTLDSEEREAALAVMSDTGCERLIESAKSS